MHLNTELLLGKVSVAELRTLAYRIPANLEEALATFAAASLLRRIDMEVTLSKAEVRQRSVYYGY